MTSNPYKLDLEAERGARIANGQEPYHAVSPDDMFFHYATDQFERIRDIARKNRIENPGLTPADAAALGIVHFCADRDRIKASEIWGKDCEFYSKGIYNPGLIDEFLSAGNIDKGLPALHISTPPVPENEPVLFAACDYGYFNKFGKVFLASLTKKSPDTWVHFHIFNAPDIDEVLEVLNHINPDKTALSSERFGFSENVPENQRRYLQVTYYHMARFIRLWKFQKYRKAPVWLTDVDVLVNKDLTPLMKMDHDIAIRMRPGRLEPWNQVAAVLVGINNTKGGMGFLTGVAAYVKYALENTKHVFWGADQQAMYSIFAHMLEDRSLSVRALMDKDTSLAPHDDDAFTWATAGVKKHAKYSPGYDTEDKYARTVHEYLGAISS